MVNRAPGSGRVVLESAEGREKSAGGPQASLSAGEPQKSIVVRRENKVQAVTD